MIYYLLSMYMNRRLVYDGLNPPSTVNEPNGSTKSEVNTTFNWKSVFTKEPNNSSIFRKHSDSNNSKARSREMKQTILRKTLGPPPPPPSRPTPLPIQEKAAPKPLPAAPYPFIRDKGQKPLVFTFRFDPNRQMSYGEVIYPTQSIYPLEPGTWYGDVYKDYNKMLSNDKSNPPLLSDGKEPQFRFEKKVEYETNKVTCVKFYGRFNMPHVTILQPSWSWSEESGHGSEDRNDAMYIIDDVNIDNFLNSSEDVQLTEIMRACHKWHPPPRPIASVIRKPSEENLKAEAAVNRAFHSGINRQVTSKSTSSLIKYRNKINPNAPLLFSVPHNTRMPQQMDRSLRPNEWDGVMYNRYKQDFNKPTRTPKPSHGIYYLSPTYDWKPGEKVTVSTFYEEENHNIPVFILQPSWYVRSHALYVVDDVENFLRLSDDEQIRKLRNASLTWDSKDTFTKEKKNGDKAALEHAESQFHGGPIKKGGSKKSRKHTRRKHTRRNRSFRK
jgi:hypothetical protein